MLVPLSMAVTGIMTCDVLSKNEVFVLQILSAAVTVAHVHYGVCVVRQMSRHFNINCFSLKKSQKLKTSLKSVNAAKSSKK